MTFDDLVNRCPELGDMAAEILTIRGDGGPSFCANDVWYGRYKGRLERLVGWLATDPYLSTPEVYDIAYEHLYNLLPDCRSCGCVPAVLR